MSDYIAIARTNYFMVKDVTAFATAMQPFDVEVITDVITDTIDHQDGNLGKGLSVGLLCHGPSGWPTDLYDDVTDTFTDIDFPVLVGEHLVDSYVAVFIEIGAQKLRYVNATATAVNSTGSRHHIDLVAKITALAATLGAHVTLPAA